MMLKTRLEMLKLLRGQKGQGMVEYGLILALIAIVVIAVLTTLGTNLNLLFDKAAKNIT